MPPVQAPAGMVFIIIDAAVTNLGNKALSVGPADFALTDSAGTKYGYSVYQGPNPFPAITLTAGQPTTAGKILFIMPATSSGLEISCVLPGNPPVKAIWKLQW